MAEMKSRNVVIAPHNKPYETNSAKKSPHTHPHTCALKYSKENSSWLPSHFGSWVSPLPSAHLQFSPLKKKKQKKKWSAVYRLDVAFDGKLTVMYVCLADVLSDFSFSFHLISVSIFATLDVHKKMHTKIRTVALRRQWQIQRPTAKLFNAVHTPYGRTSHKET